MKDYTILQLFAYNPQAQPPNNIAVEGLPGGRLTPENQTYYDKQLIRYAQPKLVHQQFGQKRDIPAKAGQTISFRSFASLGKSTVPLIEGVTPDGQSLSVTEITSKPKQYGDFVALTDYLDMTAIDPVVTETVTLIGDQAGSSIDTIVRDEINTGTNVDWAAKVSGGSLVAVTGRHELDATAALTVDVVERAAAELKAQNAPTFDGYYVCIAHPYALYDLRKDPRWQHAQEYTANNVSKIFDGEVGEIAGVRFVSTTEAKIFKGDNLNGTTRTLTVTGNESAGDTELAVGATLVADALIGREVIISGNHHTITDNSTSTITVSPAIPANVSSGTVVYPGEGGAGGIGVFSCLFIGKNAYGVTEVTGNGLKTIIKPLGSAGSADPLDQRSTIGWKALITAKILVEQYIRRVEVGGTYATVQLKAN